MICADDALQVVALVCGFGACPTELESCRRIFLRRATKTAESLPLDVDGVHVPMAKEVLGIGDGVVSPIPKERAVWHIEAWRNAVVLLTLWLTRCLGSA